MTDEAKSCWPEHKDCQHKKYIGRIVSLDKEIAIIVDGTDNFGQVGPVNVGYRAVRFTWEQIYNICDNHKGKFNAVNAG